MDPVFDVAIIGGGINGCACAADAALRGLSVLLLEKDDLASKTSSSSTKLIHGGLRYLEHYEFSLVKKALTERQKLLDLAPHLVHPQLLVLPYEKHMRPAWFLRLGLFLYDHLSLNNRLPKCRKIDKKNSKDYFAPLLDRLNKGFVFYDGITDDSRLTISNALQAKNHGASIRTYSQVIQSEIANNLWQLSIQPQIGPRYKIHAKTLINAAGPWVKDVEKLTQVANKQKISLVKGSHILVPPLYTGTQAYFLQHQDQRVIFVIPYHGFSMIGTTDIALADTPDQVAISDEETDYLLDSVNLYFKNKLQQKDIIHSWSGIRALLADEHKEAKSLSRDYAYTFSFKPAPMITVYGGKITTYRQLAEEVINQLTRVFPNLPDSITATTPLPGAVFEQMNFTQYLLYAKEKYKWMHKELLHRYVYTYGSCMEQFLTKCTGQETLGKKYGADLYQVEVDYLISEEWAQQADDLLKRRTKLDLVMDADGKKQLANYLIEFASKSLQ